MDKKTIDVFLQYYLPHVSGLTIMAADIAEHLVNHGWEVNIHCANSHQGSSYENVSGVNVYRYRIWAKIGRASIAPGLILAAFRQRSKKSLAHLHLPFPEAIFVSKLMGSDKRTVITYQCDSGVTNNSEKFLALLLDYSHIKAIKNARVTCVTSFDYANNSRIQSTLIDGRLLEIPATSRDRSGGTPMTIRAEKLDKVLIGYLGRPTSEKGISVLLDSLSFLPDEFEVVLAGPTENLSEVKYASEVMDRISKNPRVTHLGLLADDSIKDFYASIDVFTLPSTNSFEAFGIVQVEAMSAGIPVVASNLPGVRTIIQATGFGELVECKSAKSLASGILRAINSTYDRNSIQNVLNADYLGLSPLDKYLTLFDELDAKI